MAAIEDLTQYGFYDQPHRRLRVLLSSVAPNTAACSFVAATQVGAGLALALQRLEGNVSAVDPNGWRGDELVLACLLFRFYGKLSHVHLSPRHFQYRADSVDRPLDVVQCSHTTGATGQIERK